MERGTAARAVTLAVVLALLIPSVSAFGSESGTFSAEEITSQAVGERPGTTVITTDAHGGGRIVAFGPSGDVLYYNETYPYYHDVDPVAGTRATVEYVASAVVDRADCPATRDCLRSVYERLNLTTGEVTRVYARIRPKGPSRVIHDIDRIDSHRLLVAEISEPDRVYISL
jgi:hypothetical protein